MDKIVQADHISFVIEKQKVLNRLGFSPHKTVLTPQIDQLIDKQITHFEKIAQYRALYRVCPILAVHPDRIKILPSETFLTSRSLTKHLDNCIYSCLFATTIGGKADMDIQLFFSANEQAKATILDAIGSVAVELLTENLCKEVSQKLTAYDVVPVRRFSPGYGDLALSAQHAFFSLLKPARIGITLTPHLIMNPEKSITGIMGFKKIEE